MDESLLIQEYRSRILYFILRRVRNRAVAEELTQEALLIVIQALREDRVRDVSKVGSYIFGVAKNLIFEHARTTKASAGAEAELQTWMTHPEAELLLEEQRSEVRRALDALSERDREILHYTFSETESLEDVARKLRIPYTAARKRKSRALERLRKAFRKLSQKRRS